MPLSCTVLGFTDNGLNQMEVLFLCPFGQCVTEVLLVIVLCTSVIVQEDQTNYGSFSLSTKTCQLGGKRVYNRIQMADN